MFESNEDFEEYVNSIKTHRVLFKCIPDFNGDILNSDDYWTLAEEKIVELCDEYTYLEATDSVLYKFCFPELTEFYSLCKSYCNMIKRNFKKSVYVKESEEDVFKMLRESYVDSIGWNLWIPKRIINKKKYTLIVEKGCYFNQNAELLEVLYDIKNYYKEQRDKMQELINGEKIIKMPDLSKEVKAA